jgi:hypothetical protein
MWAFRKLYHTPERCEVPGPRFEVRKNLNTETQRMGRNREKTLLYALGPSVFSVSLR